MRALKHLHTHVHVCHNKLYYKPLCTQSIDTRHAEALLLPLLRLLLQPSTAMQIGSSVQLMPQNWLSGRSFLPSPVEVFCRAPQLGRQIGSMRPCQLTSLGIFCARLNGVVWCLVSLPALKQEEVSEMPILFQMGTRTTVPCAQAEDSGLLGQLQSPN